MCAIINPRQKCMTLVEMRSIMHIVRGEIMSMWHPVDFQRELEQVYTKEELQRAVEAYDSRAVYTRGSVQYEVAALTYGVTMVCKVDVESRVVLDIEEDDPFIQSI